MSLQSNISAWQGIYDNTGIYQNGGNPLYIGSVCGPSGFHQGPGIYDPSAPSGTYQIYDFNWYAGQGVPLGGSSGGKFLVGSINGFSWDTVDANNNGALEFVTSGSLNTLYLGTTPIGDSSESPECSTLTTFNPLQPLIVVNGFNIAIDAVAKLITGNGSADGNTAIPVDSSVTTPSLFTNLMSNPQYYESATLNSAILYDLAFENNAHSQQAFEYVLDQYLKAEGASLGIADTWTNIDLALSDTDVSIDYYPTALGHYPTTSCACATAEVESDLLLAA